ncbi:MAG: hypothetical protein HY926_08310 [Elusimicrobia bacterium]|nr:hypothetical protein [Elusimicrobiota bacterium]
MKKFAIGATLIAFTVVCGLVMQAFALREGKAVGMSKHDFVGVPYIGEGGLTVSAKSTCGTCHAAHKPAKNELLWKRAAPTDTGWVVWNGAAGQALDGTQDLNKYLSAADFVNSGTGMCMGCHDGQTAVGKTATPATDVFMRSAYRGRWTRNMSDIHPVGTKVPFNTMGWQADLGAGNTAAASNVAVETGGTVGCTSCHSMHSSEDSSKLLRKGNRCLACHDK